MEAGMEDSDRETSPTTLQVRPIAAPDFLDFKAEEGASTGGVSPSSSSPNESAKQSPVSSHSGFLNVPPSQQPQLHQHQHQHQHQSGGASKAMFDSAFDALVIANVANDVASMSLLQGDKGSQNVGDALLGLAMSQALQGNNAPFGPSSS
ncbi:hypothetical protein L7F22_017798 [Adiantum nelumboides]|nr:hypothetical protein [Adiantum nelumboides]